jgi:hypothetical protein
MVAYFVKKDQVFGWVSGFLHHDNVPSQTTLSLKCFWPKINTRDETSTALV